MPTKLGEGSGVMGDSGFGYDPEAIYQEADIEAAEFEREARYAEAQRLKAVKLRAAGKLIEASELCPHGAQYTLSGKAAEWAGDPRHGEAGERCRECNSVLSEYRFGDPDPGPWPQDVLHPCEPAWDEERGDG